VDPDRRPTDEELWRRTAASHRPAEEIYRDLLAGSAHPDAIDELIVADRGLSELLRSTAGVPMRPELQRRIEQVARPRWTTWGSQEAPERWSRWGQWSSLAASLLVASAVGLMVGRSVGQSERRDLPRPGLWTDDVDTLSIEGIFPSREGEAG
jgi:hypothetical protein